METIYIGVDGNSTVERQLDYYRSELGMYSPLTLTALISSHRNNRASLRELQDSIQSVRQKALEEARTTAKEYALENEWISVEKLKGMTLMQIADLLVDN